MTWLIAIPLLLGALGALGYTLYRLVGNRLEALSLTRGLDDERKHRQAIEDAAIKEFERVVKERMERAEKVTDPVVANDDASRGWNRLRR